MAEQIEEERRLPPSLVASLHEAGLFRMLLPRALAGGEVDPVTFVRVIEEIAKADASTAWCLCQASGCSMTAAYLEPAVGAEIFGQDPLAVLAWGPGPDARAVAAEGGYRVTGTWSFASGCRHATWLGGECPITDADGAARRRADGKPRTRTMLFPAGRATMIDVWHVSGLTRHGQRRLHRHRPLRARAVLDQSRRPRRAASPGHALLLPARKPVRVGLRRRGARHRPPLAGRAGRASPPRRRRGAPSGRCARTR